MKIAFALCHTGHPSSPLPSNGFRSRQIVGCCWRGEIMAASHDCGSECLSPRTRPTSWRSSRPFRTPRPKTWKTAMCLFAGEGAYNLPTELISGISSDAVLSVARHNLSKQPLDGHLHHTTLRPSRLALTVRDRQQESLSKRPNG